MPLVAHIIALAALVVALAAARAQRKRAGRLEIRGGHVSVIHRQP